MTRLFGPSAAGSLRRDIPPRTFVVSDQAIDHDEGPHDHVPRRARRPRTSRSPTRIAPRCGRRWCRRPRELGIDHRDGGTMVVIEGPRFSTRAESKMFAQMGGDVIGMTQFPEVSLAREVGDLLRERRPRHRLRRGRRRHRARLAREVLKVFGENIASLRDLLFAAIPAVPAERDCACATALSGSSWMARQLVRVELSFVTRGGRRADRRTGPRGGGADRGTRPLEEFRVRTMPLDPTKKDAPPPRRLTA